MRTVRAATVSLALALLCGDAKANCGSAVCAVPTNWNLQGIPPTAGNGRIDLHYEYIDQNRPWAGTRRADAAGDEAARETRTINRNLVAGLDYTLSPHWSATLLMSVLDRVHTHVADPEGTPALERWDFTRLGDAKVSISWRDVDEEEPSEAWGIQAGLKLPTGSHRVANADGVVAERSLQPGTGSTDLLLGVFVTRPGRNGAFWFGQVTGQVAVATSDGYRPGNLFTVSGGYRFPLSLHVTGVAQLVATRKGQDTGTAAEPDLTGNTQVHVVPGLSWGLNPLTDLYAFAELPAYRNTRGAQLTFDWSLVVGATRRF
ncbi:MAG: hypothetical protein GC151_03205 [Betaproteobacteria bacterium]|nr:hypothetical protein [Betaproteobacteria bacterium]